ncbi:MAG: tRNA (adenosine(37)-N6)-dimethylallyltransferase MiaA [Candidatus Omnitrophica bacterium]|nr:tRNA (adenosine(37)-N6)-dimethylallyltransferase MiaA [Candidatus Omnitrophota bacterium]
MKEKVIFIVGPTAVGKTSLAIKLAKKIKGEIISADSMQVYKGMDILSQKPTKRERSAAPHHLISFLKASDEYSAAIFAKMAEKKIEGIIKKGKIPIVVGGSGLYIKTLIDGIFPSKGKDEKIRQNLRQIADRNGSIFLHNKLKRVDPLAAQGIHPNDLKRVIRALEIYELEKKTKTSLKPKTTGLKDIYDVRIFGLNMNRGKLYERINKRVDLMFKKGIVNEVKKLLRKTLSVTSKQALGIKEIEGYFNKAYDETEAKDALKKNTRRFAKRQLTWFRADKRIVWLDIDKTREAPATRIIHGDVWKEHCL